MEDMATGEIRLSILWEWLHKGAPFTEDDAATGVKAGDRFSPELFERLLAEEYEKLLAAGNRDVHDDSKNTTLPIAREIVETYVMDDVKLPVVHRPAQHQPRQPRPAPGQAAHRAVPVRASAATAPGITENLDFDCASTPIEERAMSAFDARSRDRALVRTPALRGHHPPVLGASGGRAAGHHPDRLHRGASGGRAVLRPAARAVRAAAADHHLRPLLAGAGGGAEAGRDRGDLPRRLGDLGQGLGHRGPGPRPRQLPAQPGARRGGAHRAGAARPPTATSASPARA